VQDHDQLDVAAACSCRLNGMRSAESEISVPRSIDSTLRQAAPLDGGLVMDRTPGTITAPCDAGASIAD